MTGRAVLAAIAIACGAAAGATSPSMGAERDNRSSVGTEGLPLSESSSAHGRRDPEPEGGLTNQEITIHGKAARNHSPTRDDSQAVPPEPPRNGDSSDNLNKAESPIKIKNAPKKRKVDIRSESCTNMGVEQCAAAQTGCMTDAGGRDAYRPPTITWVRVDGGTWQYAGLSCGPPTSVEVPGASGPVDVEIEAPPVPTLGQIQRAFRSLPFSKPSVTIQPKGQRTAKNLKTFYAAQWPDDDDLQPGEISKPVKLLSWNVEFKVAAKDYRYDYGDGSKSGWTTSTGGTYPDGDITHTYSETGDVEVKVDARLTGQYRVNGGEWQDIATVADLQDEPSFTLEVRGTKTTLVDN